jgi:hypothetical protein
VSIQSVLLPVFVQVGLIFVVCFWMIYARHSKAGGTESGTLAGDSFRNQFEIPVLFFALVPLAILTRKTDYLFVALAWVFVLSRIAHAFVHNTSNRQPARGVLWLIGVATLLVMWVLFALSVLFPPFVGRI